MGERPHFSIRIDPLSPEDGGGFLATVPDLPGCMSDGETEFEAIHADSCDISTSTATTTISAAGGVAFISPSKSGVQSLLRATIFPSSKTVHRTSTGLRFFGTLVARCGIGQRPPKRHTPVASSAPGQQCR